MPGCPFVAADILVLGEDVDAAVRAGARHDVDLQFEIPEAVVSKWTVVVRMAGRAICNDGSVLDGEGLCRSGNLPAREVLAVEQAREAWFQGGCSGLRGCRERSQNE